MVTGIVSHLNAGVILVVTGIVSHFNSRSYSGGDSQV